MFIGYDGIFALQRAGCGVVECKTVEVDSVVAHSAGEVANAPLGTLGAVRRVEQGAHRHNFMVDVS